MAVLKTKEMPIKKNIKKKQINRGNRRRGIKEMIRIEVIKIISGK
jgi:hypothetical protein